MSLYVSVLRLFLGFTHFQNLPKLLDGHVVQPGVIIIQAVLTLPTRDGPGGQELLKPDSLIQCAGWMEKPIRTGNFQRRKGRDQPYLVFPGLHLENPRRYGSCDPSYFCLVDCSLAGGSGASAEGIYISHLCKVSSRDSLRRGPGTTCPRSWAWKEFYLPTGDLLKYFHHIQSLVAG